MQVPEASGWFSVQTSITINAPLERVWEVLTDLEHYGEWNSFVPSMQADLRVGATLTMRVRMRGNLATTSVETITALEPQRLLAWKIRSPAWILRGERFQVIKAINEQTTEYWTQESFTGIVAPLLQVLFARDLQRGFQTMARDLQARAEAARV
ncbi:SRPBCC domain-containing protein [Ktedonospora formicarum]|uniref:SRPBCC domain-containing protein n=1 Tax=Ktedonospora formicarum TaxID=2778364 RepID=A0A8J3I7N1_9CHLR|nr:SRPBCC domain-containing protein [Ktedonospora formicarum]GHO46209.1 hypothetical protein KSX_43720 [Ktedonospora formicarum]